MNNFLRILATVDHPQLLENMVEKLAQQNNRHAFAERFETGNWRSFNSSTVESLVNGSLVFNTADDTASSFTTGFLFTCLKHKNTDYKLSWSLSLS